MIAFVDLGKGIGLLLLRQGELSLLTREHDLAHMLVEGAKLDPGKLRFSFQLGCDLMTCRMVLRLIPAAKRRLHRRVRDLGQHRPAPQLLQELYRRGYGWLKPEGVRRKLEELAAQRRP